jgi:hypothetical protein
MEGGSGLSIRIFNLSTSFSILVMIAVVAALGSSSSYRCSEFSKSFQRIFQLTTGTFGVGGSSNFSFSFSVLVCCFLSVSSSASSERSQSQALRRSSSSVPGRTRPSLRASPSLTFRTSCDFVNDELRS